MSQLTVEILKKKAKEHQITEWIIHHCSMCNYPCGYKFDDDKVSYDCGCYCILRPPHLRNWDNVLKQIKMQDHPDVIARYHKFWHFDPTKE